MSASNRQKKCDKCGKSVNDEDLERSATCQHIFHRECFSLYAKINQMECPACSRDNQDSSSMLKDEKTRKHSTLPKTNITTRSVSHTPATRKDSAQDDRNERRTSISLPPAADDGEENMETQSQYEILASKSESGSLNTTDMTDGLNKSFSSVSNDNSVSDQGQTKTNLSRCKPESEVRGASTDSTTFREGHRSSSMSRTMSSERPSHNDQLSNSKCSSPSSVKNTNAKQSLQSPGKLSLELEYQEYGHKNDGNKHECTTCLDRDRSSTIAKEKSNDSTRETDNKSSSQQAKPSKSSIIKQVSQRDFMVFIPELPFGISKSDLEEMIQCRLNKSHNIRVTKVICYPNLDVGIMFVQSEEDFDNCVYQLQSIVLNPQTKTVIQFDDKLELICYIVFDQNMKISISTDEITHQWLQLAELLEPVECQRVSISFPNIFKMIARYYDKPDVLESLTEFVIRGQTAKLYWNVECSFFEKLPPNITIDQIVDAINTELVDSCDPKSFYIQYNKSLSNAIVLSTSAAHEWRNIYKILLNNQVYRKRAKLTVNDASDDVIVQDEQSQHDDSYDACASKQMTVKPKDKSLKDKYSGGEEEKDVEINETNWYKEEMLNYEPDLEEFIFKRQHPIFKWKWNKESWLEQFRRFDGPHNGALDRERRLLRVTVMLNTIGVLRKKFYTVDTKNGKKQIKLNPPRMKNIVYNHRSKLADKREIPLPLTPPFSSTVVKVVEEDCLVVHQELLSQNKNPVLLNMANEKTPGGGYRKGAGAQEENLFRRSNYYLSLDMEFDENNEADRFWCTDNCKEEFMGAHENMYPIEAYGAIYTSGITVFRDTEMKGYDLLEQPVYDVCAIASAAYIRPKLKADHSNVLEEKYAVGTRKKIENFFAIAHHHGHDCLILSAFGCGAFRNPPEHIALIYKSVIEQYAGYFREIYFAIINDHNTGGQLNPNGNYLPFKQILDDFNVSPPKNELDFNMISGPFRILQKQPRKLLVDDIKIYDRSPCKYASLCRSLDNQHHYQSYSHPPKCPRYDSCDQSIQDEVHLSSFFHRQKSQHGATKKLVNDQCLLGSYCPRFHDKEHLDAQKHPFQTPCPFTPFTCEYHTQYLKKGTNSPSKMKGEIERHFSQFSHVCPFGRQCRVQDPSHFQTFIHISRNMCPYLPNCSKLSDEEHLNSFTHPDVNDIRYICYLSKAECPDTQKPDHILRYRHRDNCDNLDVVPYCAFNQNIRFLKNQQKMIETIRRYAELNKWTPAKNSFEEIIEWVRALLPVYRCNELIFESILVHGHVMSRKRLEKLREPQYIAESICQQYKIRRILDKNMNADVQRRIRAYIQTLIENELNKAPVSTDRASRYAGDGDFTSSSSSFYSSSSNRLDQSSSLQRAESILKDCLPPDELDTIRKHTLLAVQVSLNLQKNSVNLGQSVDELFEMNDRVITTLGPKSDLRFGDIVIVFKHEIMFHPDSDFSVQPATSYNRNGKAYSRQPWLKDPKLLTDRIADFNSSRLHCSVPGYDYAAAMELSALIGSVKNTMNVKLRDVQDYWKTCDTDEVFEGHLPCLIPLDYIDRIFIPKSLCQSLSSSSKDLAGEIFRDKLTIINDNTSRSATSYSDPQFHTYESNVHDDIKQLMTTNNFHSHRGTIITLPATKFEKYVCVPFTISQILLQEEASANLSDTVHIYWEAFGGDMMLVISQNAVDPSHNRSRHPSVMCYIADMPSRNSDNNRESYSYLTIDQPNLHDTLVQTDRFRAKSNTFHRGCNIYDYIRYYLKIHFKTGEITLTHAGSSGIYNHQKVSCTFRPSELDINDLEYIHLSAYGHTVPIRNLVAHYEPINDYHPSVDMNFQGNDKSSVSSPKSSIHVPNNLADIVPKFDYTHKEQPSRDQNKNQPVINNNRKLTPCRDGVNCLDQYSRNAAESHNNKFSHPCRFSELCQKKADHPHLEHRPHLVPLCRLDIQCSQLTDPYHRGLYRHTNYPDFLIPCQLQPNCLNKKPDHLIKYSHGEKVPPPYPFS